MRIIKLDAIDSTNTFLKEISSADALEDYTVVIAKAQTKGKGRMGNEWNSKSSKNLTFSVFKHLHGVSFERQFYLSIVTALAITKTLEAYNISKLFVKWPNDILSADKKIAGILIENVIKQNKLAHSIIGIGLNVNQIEFEHLPRASSLKKISGKTFDLDEVLQHLLINLKYYFSLLESGEIEMLKHTYEAQLFRKNKPSTFENVEGELFSGFIQGISNTGNLIVLLEDAIIKEFSLNEIKLRY
ncbi:biotin--[acetyl-CoA-carboxylase] ligase [Lacinutrix sp. Hel_I_90]|uniref:biotin--[acetyl-CoA-carboxylase] ligase n=1 Tax=Lacinutrix sp. Hel_I_90 TaxID=1249999 RepID=UPI0005C9E979|nr:biotin--[acetyl-CoA-carboxylase] ligase [Lacinutrix sp. Hel_I_90]